MITFQAVLIGLITAGTLAMTARAESQGDPQRGAQAFGACAACHSVKPGEHMTGPSLGRAWGAKAGATEGFMRYSEALKKSGIVWNGQTLDKWLANPADFIPNNAMNFPGVKEAKVRRDLIAYLKNVSEGKAPAPPRQRGGPVNLKQAPADSLVVALTHCGDTYTVKTASGETHRIWEFNLRLKTDSSNNGPDRGKPVITGSGMMGDRASIVFAAPGEISAYIKEACP